MTSKRILLLNMTRGKNPTSPKIIKTDNAIVAKIFNMVCPTLGKIIQGSPPPCLIHLG
jgi:hypothetical protein